MLKLSSNLTLRCARFWMLLVALVGVMPSASMVIAQDNAAAAPAAEEPAAAADAPAAAPAGGEAPKPPKSFLVWVIEALTIPYALAFLALSFTLLALVVMSILTARRDNVCPTDLVAGVEDALNQNNLQGAVELAANGESMLGQVLTAGFSKLEKSHSHAIEAMGEVGEEESMKIEHRLGYIALIGNVSPMIGLLGTVQGMVASFEVIARNNTTPKPADLAGGIPTALMTTLVGLIIAIPAIAVYNVLRNRLQRLILELGNTSHRLMSRFEDKR